MAIPRSRLLTLGASSLVLALMMLTSAPRRLMRVAVPPLAGPMDPNVQTDHGGRGEELADPTGPTYVPPPAPRGPGAAVAAASGAGAAPTAAEEEEEEETAEAEEVTAAEPVAPRPRRRDPGTERFLVFFTHWGLSNQLLSLDSALRMAEGLNRTLVLPELLSHDGARRFRYARLFDLPGLRSGVYDRVVEMDDFLDYGLMPSTLYVPYTSDPNTEALWGALGWARLNRTELKGVATSRDMRALIDTFAASEEQALGFASLFYYGNDHLRHPDTARRMATILTLHPSLRTAVDAATAQVSQAAKGGRFACMHLRRGDFKEHCHFLLDWLAKVDYIRKWHNGSDCYPSLPNVARNLNDAGIAESLIYVSTDNVTTLAEPELAGFSFTHLGAVKAHLSAALDAVVAAGVPRGEATAMLDQAVCAGGDTLLLNDYSTFSDSIGFRAVGQRPGTRLVYFQHNEKLG